MALKEALKMFSDKLKELRTRKGLSQKALSELLFVSQQTIGKWETNKATPNPETISKIADIFETTSDYLLDRKTKPQIENITDLTNRDKREIADVIEEYKEQLLSADGLMLDGEIIDEEDVQKIITAMQLGMEMIKKDNKERFTPKKYKK